jgi:hypothetical protein
MSESRVVLISYLMSKVWFLPFEGAKSNWHMGATTQKDAPLNACEIGLVDFRTIVIFYLISLCCCHKT